MGQVTFGKKIIEYSIKKGSRRKTLAISITPASAVVVLAPYSLNEDKIESIVKNKSRWIHELAHLKVKNHSADFWRLVSLVLPDFQARRNWLKNYSPALKI